MVNLFSFGCHVIDRTYVRVYRLWGWGRGYYLKGGRGVSGLSWKVHIFILGIHKMVHWQLSKQDSHWPVSHDHIAGSCVNSSRWRHFKLSADKLLVVKWSQAQVWFFLNSYEICFVFVQHNYNFDLKLTFSQLLQVGKTVACDFAHHGSALVTFYV